MKTQRQAYREEINRDTVIPKDKEKESQRDSEAKRQG